MHSDYQHGGGGGGGGPEGGLRRSRAPVARKTVDCHASLVYHLQHRFYQPPNLPRPYLPPTVDSVPFLPALFPPPSPSWPPRFVADHFCTRYVHQSINKQRTAIHCCGFSPDNKRLVTGAASGELTLWNAQTFNFETILAAHDDAVRCMEWGGEGSAAVLATGDDSGVIKYWQASMNNLKAIKAHKGVVRDVCFSPHSNAAKLASCSDDHTVSVWDVEYSKEDVGIAGHGWDVKSCHWHPHSSLLATGSKDNSVKGWDARTGREEWTLHGHKNTVNVVRWNGNGHWLCSGGRDRIIKVWDARTLTALSTHRLADKDVTAACWHPTSEPLLVSASYDGHVKYWVVGEEAEACDIQSAHDKEVNDLCFHPLGHLLVTVSTDQYTKWWSRNKPGDEMADKFNVRALGGGRRVEAMMELQEAQRVNPMARGANPNNTLPSAQGREAAVARGMPMDGMDAGWAMPPAAAGTMQQQGPGGGGRVDGAGMGAGAVPLGFAEAGRAVVEERERQTREKADERRRDWERDRERIDRARETERTERERTKQSQPQLSERERFERELQERMAGRERGRR